MIFYHYYKEYNIDNKISNFYIHVGSNYNNLSFFEGKKVVFLLIDDCSYSGTQMNFNIKSIVNNSLIKFNYNLIVILPYITKTSIELFMRNYNDVNIEKNLSNIKKINILYSDLISNNIDFTNNNNVLQNNDLIFKLKINDKILITSLFTIFNILDSNYPIIFQHKLADSLSIYSCLYEYGIVFNNIINIYHINYSLEFEEHYEYAQFVKKHIGIIKGSETFIDEIEEIYKDTNDQDFDIPYNYNVESTPITTIKSDINNYKLLDFALNCQEELQYIERVSKFLTFDDTMCGSSIFIKKLYKNFFIKSNINNILYDNIKELYC